MFAYCRNNPVHRKDTSRTTERECFEPDGDILSEEEELAGTNNGGVKIYRYGYDGPMDNGIGKCSY